MVSSPSNSGASQLSSALSSHSSDEFGEDVKMEDEDDIVDDLPDQFAPTAKKRRTGHYSHQSTPAPLQQLSPEDLGDISSDTSGSIPNSPSEDRLKMPDDDPIAHEQVTVCRWQDCTVGDLENMDNLVQHLQDDHVAGKQTSYACEWHGCQRKGQAHASGYALKAHMRSHTKEKPFYCALPECDRSFTRSDALAKHMRTVHETEALRPSDPVPRNYSSAHFKPQRLKLIMNSRRPNLDASDLTGGGGGGGPDMVDEDGAALDTPTDLENEGAASNFAEHSPQHHHRQRKSAGTGTKPPIAPSTTITNQTFLPDLIDPSLPPDQAYKLLRRQLHWAEADSEELRTACAALSKTHRQEWMRKELVLSNLMEAELAVAHVLNTTEVTEGQLTKILDDLPPVPLPMVGSTEVWYRRIRPDGDEDEGGDTGEERDGGAVGGGGGGAVATTT